MNLQNLIRTCALPAVAAMIALPCPAANQDSIEVQNAREGVVKARGAKAHYTKKWDLSDLPHYKPKQQLKGKLRIWGNNYIKDGYLGEYWRAAFKKFQPGIEIEYNLPTTGIGIPSDKQERIFEAYYTTKEKGTGLGLATVKHNVELYGGAVRVESELGKGARFILLFPAKTLIKLANRIDHG